MTMSMPIRVHAPYRCTKDAIMILIIVVSMSTRVLGAPQASAMFVFGESTVDNGNNNYLRSIAKANYYPYGIDTPGGFPSGEFCNGRNIADLIGEKLGVPKLPSYADPLTRGTRLSQGVNFASAAAGILEETGQHYGERYSLSQQVLNFENVLSQLRTMMNGTTLAQYLAKSIVIMVFGSNDYINNYLMPNLYSSSYRYNPVEFGNLLLNRYTQQILSLQSLGLRKFFLAAIGPLGCIPNQRATGQAPPDRCVDYVNQILGTFNDGLRTLVDQLNRNHPGSVFVRGDTYHALGDILNSPATYGFRVIDSACCGIGRNRGVVTCIPLQVPCQFRNEYVFWDAFHTTEATNSILAERAYSGPQADCYPINLQQMALL